MAGGVNRVTILGRLGRDPETRQAGQTTVTTMAIATSESWIDKNTGQKQESTEWHKVQAWGKVGENCAKYLSKGREVYVEGKLKTDKYEKDGQTHYSTSITATMVQFIGGQGQQQPQGQQGGYQPPPQQHQPPKQQYQQPQNGYNPQGQYPPQQPTQNQGNQRGYSTPPDDD